MKCINYNCISNKEGVCTEEIINCRDLINATHTPSYAEEQLNHAIKKQKDDKVCYTKECQHNKDNECQVGKANCLIAKPSIINYEEEYYKLEKENEELNKENTDLQENSMKYYNIAKDLKREKRELEGRLEATEFNNKTLEKEITEINNYIVSLEAKIEELEKELKYEEQQKGMTKVFLEGRTNNLEKELHKYKDAVKILAGLL